ncbi:MAG: helix-turn-helix domain-containing protein, partial [Lachnospiraceae bacterium]|nr:helix-turn-helix domain-containing protein [Lachnospiraceae bacterium]
DILWRISERSEHVFTPEEIFNLFWNGQPWDGGQMVQMHMSRLRRKLEKAGGDHRFIETVWGECYRFVATEP